MFSNTKKQKYKLKFSIQIGILFVVLLSGFIVNGKRAYAACDVVGILNKTTLSVDRSAVKPSDTFKVTASAKLGIGDRGCQSLSSGTIYFIYKGFGGSSPVKVKADTFAVDRHTFSADLTSTHSTSWNKLANGVTLPASGATLNVTIAIEASGVNQQKSGSLSIQVSSVATPIPPSDTSSPPPNSNSPKSPAVAGAVEKSITDYLCTPDGEGKGTNALIFNCVNKLYRFSIAFGVSVAILFIIFAGYLYMSGSEKGVSEAKSIIENTAAGLLILFVSFLLLRQINPELTRFKSIQLPQIAPPGNTVTPDYVDIIEIDDTSSSGGGTVAAGRGLTDAEAKALLKAAGIAWNSGVTMGGIHEAVVNELIAVKQKCNCSITISAVTNGTHASGPCSHANGYKADTGVNSSLDSYVKNFSRIGDRSDGSAQYRDPATGAVWAYELVEKTNRYHWDMKAGC